MNPEPTILDASALLAYLLDEPGRDLVEEAIRRGAVMSSVNLSEVVAKLIRYGVPHHVLTALVERSGVDIVPFDDRHALAAGLLSEQTHLHGLSLGDRACLALAEQCGLPVLTADREWLKLELNIEITAIRQLTGDL